MRRLAALTAMAVLLCNAWSCKENVEDAAKADDSTVNVRSDIIPADSILKEVETVYATCKTYTDTGLVETTFATSNGTFEAELPFKTAFVRPERFRFEYSTKYSYPLFPTYRHIIWRHGDNVRSWWDVQPGIKQELSLGVAIATATGVSHGCARTIPTLLMPQELGGSHITRLANARRTDDADLEGVPCYRVQGTHPGAGDVALTLWISRETFLIHRIDETSEAKEGPKGAPATTSTTTYKPQIDIEIDEAALAFNPPEPASD